MRNTSRNTVPTRPSLLFRMKDFGDRQAWEEFHGLYSPLLYRYATRRGLPPEDAEEIRDECLMIIARKISAFDYDRQRGTFKGWMFRIAHGLVVDWIRRRRTAGADVEQMARVPDPHPSPEEVWDTQWKEEHLRYCFRMVRSEVCETTWQAFNLLLFSQCSVEEVCERLSINANQVYKAKSRILARIRRRWEDLESGPSPDVSEPC